MAKLGKVSLIITDEELNSSVDATSYPVEKGSPFTDHVQEKTQTLEISGFVLGSDYKTRLQYLRDSMRKGTILTYTGRTTAKNVIILNIDDSRTVDVGNGSSISIKLQYIRLVKNSWDKAPAKQKTQQKKVTSAGKKQTVVKKKSSPVYHTIKKGDSYWALAKKYGSTVKQLETWNKYPANALPIGKKVRVA